jgi:hypothetical protein
MCCMRTDLILAFEPMIGHHDLFKAEAGVCSIEVSAKLLLTLFVSARCIRPCGGAQVTSSQRHRNSPGQSSLRPRTPAHAVA